MKLGCRLYPHLDPVYHVSMLLDTMTVYYFSFAMRQIFQLDSGALVLMLVLGLLSAQVALAQD